VTDWLKPGAVPPDAASELDDDDGVNDDTDTPEPSTAQPASGGYGTASGKGSSGGSGEGTDDTSSPGGDAQSEWLRDARGGPR
jgi:hypothetical protein